MHSAHKHKPRHSLYNKATRMWGHLHDVGLLLGLQGCNRSKLILCILQVLLQLRALCLH